VSRWRALGLLAEFGVWLGLALSVIPLVARFFLHVLLK
jgi:hypothetical protein